MTPYHDTFFPIFAVGFLVAATFSFFAARSSGCLAPGILLVFGIGALWVAMFLGSDLGYRAWQAMPNPPDEAFQDTSVAGALFLGWFPSSIVNLMLFGFFRAVRWLLHWANPDAFPVAADDTPRAVETGNPFQSPGGDG